MKGKEEDLSRKLASIQEKFDKDIEEHKAKWATEKKETELLLKEEDEKTIKDRKREEDNYNYNLKLTRKKEQDIYDQKLAALELEMNEKMAGFEKEINEREKAIIDSEKEFNEFKKQSEQFPKELEKSIKETEVRITGKLETEYKYEKDLLAKENEGQLNLNDLTIKTLQNKITEQETFINQLTQKTDSSEKTVKDIAIKAIESSAKFQMIEKTGKDKEEKE